MSDIRDLGFGPFPWKKIPRDVKDLLLEFKNTNTMEWDMYTLASPRNTKMFITYQSESESHYARLLHYKVDHGAWIQLKLYAPRKRINSIYKKIKNEFENGKRTKDGVEIWYNSKHPAIPHLNVTLENAKYHEESKSESEFSFDD